MLVVFLLTFSISFFLIMGKSGCIGVAAGRILGHWFRPRGCLEGRGITRAWWACLGTRKHHSHLPIIIKAVLGCLLNLHNTVPTLLPLLSIMTGMRRWGPLLLCSSSPFVCLFSLWLCLVFICPSTKDWFPTVSPPYVQQIWIFTGWWSTKSANNKQKNTYSKTERGKPERREGTCLCLVDEGRWMLWGKRLRKVHLKKVN